MSSSLRVLFLLQRAEAWINMASVYRSILTHEHFEPVVWQLPYDVSNLETCARKDPQTRAILDATDIPYVTWCENMSLDEGGFDAVIFGHPYDAERPSALRFERVAAVVPVTIYIPYGMPMGCGRKNLWHQYAQPTQTHASAVIARSLTEKRQYARHCPTGDAHVHVTGLPRFDQLLAELEMPPRHELTDFIGGRKAVLWNPHFSFAPRFSQSLNFSTFDLIGPELFDLARRLQNDLCLMWRPHPLLWTTIFELGLIGECDVPALRAELAANGIWLDESPLHAASFRVSDALLTDTGSFLIEYLPTRKPVLALQNPEGEGYNDEAHLLVSNYATATNTIELEAFVDRLLRGEQPPPGNAVIERHLPLLDGNAGARVADLVARLCGQQTDDNPDRYVRTEHPGIKGHSVPPSPARNGWKSTPAPTLDRLCQGLRIIREQKQLESRWRKSSRRLRNAVGMELNAWLKRHPHLSARIKHALGYSAKLS